MHVWITSQNIPSIYFWVVVPSVVCQAMVQPSMWLCHGGLACLIRRVPKELLLLRTHGSGRRGGCRLHLRLAVDCELFGFRWCWSMAGARRDFTKGFGTMFWCGPGWLLSFPLLYQSIWQIHRWYRQCLCFTCQAEGVVKGSRILCDARVLWCSSLFLPLGGCTLTGFQTHHGWWPSPGWSWCALVFLQGVRTSSMPSSLPKASSEVRSFRSLSLWGFSTPCRPITCPRTVGIVGELVESTGGGIGLCGMWVAKVVPTESPKDRRKDRNGSCLMFFDLVTFGRADICRCYQVWPDMAVRLYVKIPWKLIQV